MKSIYNPDKNILEEIPEMGYPNDSNSNYRLLWGEENGEELAEEYERKYNEQKTLCKKYIISGTVPEYWRGEVLEENIDYKIQGKKVYHNAIDEMNDKYFMQYVAVPMKENKKEEVKKKFSKEIVVKDAYDFLTEKFGSFNKNHPIGHLGYTKGLELDIEDIINAMEEYKSLPSAPIKEYEEISKDEVLRMYASDYAEGFWPEEDAAIKAKISMGYRAGYNVAAKEILDKDLEEVSKPFPQIHFPEKEGMIYPEKEVNESQDELRNEVYDTIYRLSSWESVKNYLQQFSITRINTDKR